MAADARRIPGRYFVPFRTATRTLRASWRPLAGCLGPLPSGGRIRRGRRVDGLVGEGEEGMEEGVDRGGGDMDGVLRFRLGNPPGELGERLRVAAPQAAEVLVEAFELFPERQRDSHEAEREDGGGGRLRAGRTVRLRRTGRPPQLDDLGARPLSGACRRRGVLSAQLMEMTALFVPRRQRGCQIPLRPGPPGDLRKGVSEELSD